MIRVSTLAAIVVPITQAAKRWLNRDGYVALAISAVVAILLALWKTLSFQPYNWAAGQVYYPCYRRLPGSEWHLSLRGLCCG